MTCTVYNASRETPLGDRVACAAALRQRLVGLLGRSGLAPGEGLRICPCAAIHTFFMRFPIDVAFLDGEGVVLAMVHSLPPWRATRLVASARSALELPAGTLAASGTRVGDRLRFTPNEARDCGLPSTTFAAASRGDSIASRLR